MEGAKDPAYGINPFGVAQSRDRNFPVAESEARRAAFSAAVTGVGPEAAGRMIEGRLGLRQAASPAVVGCIIITQTQAAFRPSPILVTAAVRRVMVRS
jgi:hypothetical protein